MNRDSTQKVVDGVSALLALPLQASADFDRKNCPITVRLSGLREQETFHLKCQRTPLTWIVDLAYDLFSRPFAEHIVKVALDNNSDLTSELERVKAAQITVETNLLSLVTQERSRESLRDKLELRFSSEQLTDQLRVNEDEEVETLSRLLTFSLMVMYLLISNFERDDVLSSSGETEGDRLEKLCGSYGRSARNRMECLELYGCVCQACQMAPEDIYGVAGKSIIHVHHRTPLSMMGGPGTVNPETDLVPLCPNCHNFAHKRNPPYSVEEIREIVSRREDNDV
jgi:predicted HNH restriction endonuclease